MRGIFGALLLSNDLQQAGLLLQADYQPGAAIRAICAQPADAALASLAISQLRGRGGAGYPTFAKWQACRQAPGVDKVVVCNADEGEPGTFKDRYLLQHHPDQVIEGMTLCAALIGAQLGFIYLRGEYAFLLAQLEAVLASHRRQGLLGASVCGRADLTFDIQIHLGAGSYVCGEETALLESLEGKRGIPRKRPPFPVTAGYLGRPTVVNNVETFFAAAAIAVHGADWFCAQGTKYSAGTRLFSVSGDCARPGIYEMPFGTSVRQLLASCGATETQAVQISGAAGELLCAADFDRQFAFEDLSCNGSVMVFNKQRDILALMHNFAHFFMQESCGFCTPCRVGTALLYDELDRCMQQQATQRDMQRIDSISQLLRTASHCGLGQRAAYALQQARTKFPAAFGKQQLDNQSVPAFDLDAALGAARTLVDQQRAETKAQGRAGRRT